jgi:hypothetical protein
MASQALAHIKYHFARGGSSEATLKIDGPPQPPTP